MGLMWGLDLNVDAAPVVPAGLARGVIVNRTAETVVRLLPPLIITEAEVDDALGATGRGVGRRRCEREDELNAQIDSHRHFGPLKPREAAERSTR